MGTNAMAVLHGARACVGMRWPLPGPAGVAPGAMFRLSASHMCCALMLQMMMSYVMLYGATRAGFDKHTDDDHNMWVYMYFLIHIREIEDKTELNGVESYVWELAKMNDVSFFPVGRSMRLDVMGGLHDPVKEVRYKRGEIRTGGVTCVCARARVYAMAPWRYCIGIVTWSIGSSPRAPGPAPGGMDDLQWR